MRCPDGYTHCGNTGSQSLDSWVEWFFEYKDNIICVREGMQETECPITNINFIPGPNFGGSLDPRPSRDPTIPEADDSEE